ncbi:MAG: formate C-acetyltransferase [Firmicutes bacterium]|nr:formate C-acetyltransferase [Bacillota bacterium]
MQENKNQGWDNFKGTKWKNKIDVRHFIVKNFTPYKGGHDFLVGASAKTAVLRDKYLELLNEEKKRGGVYKIDSEKVISVLSHDAGYLDKENEVIVGLQTDEPLKRGLNPFGGIRMARTSAIAYGHKVSDLVEEQFKYKTTHNDGVYRVYTPEMKKFRNNGVITGLPDAYGRGRIIGDYRRVALYGVDKLIEEKMNDFVEMGNGYMSDERIRLREELYRQREFLWKLKDMALLYGHDISNPAKNAKEAVQWTYYAYLGAIKEANGAAMSLGRVSTFFDIYIEKDIADGILTETEAQELIDQFVLKLRMARHLRTPEYNDLFVGDPTWVTEAIGGMCEDGRTMVTKTSFRFLHTLYNLETAPEPNMTVLWSKDLPEKFKLYCAKVSHDTSSVQYENDDLMREPFGDDYGIACCVSAMTLGKQMQYFGARCNIVKLLLLCLNGGKDEMTGDQILPESPNYKEMLKDGGVLDYKKVKKRFLESVDYLCEQYVNTMNIIHFMHDKYAYEKVQMALHDTKVERLMAFGIAGISVLADSLSAIKYAKVTPITDERGIVVDYLVEGEFPTFGNDEEGVDDIAKEVVEYFYSSLKKTPCYRDAIHTLSLLTITSNVVYGKLTGNTPCGRKEGEPFAPGANPYHNREKHGALASLNSVAKLSYDYCKDGISNTFSIAPKSLGKNEKMIFENISALLDGYFKSGGFHLNVNMHKKEDLQKAHEAPKEYPNLTVRVSGYAVRFGVLSTKHRQEVLDRTFF